MRPQPNATPAPNRIDASRSMVAAAIAGAAILLTVSVVLTVLSVTTVGFFEPDDAGGIAWFTVALWVLFALTVLIVLRWVPGRATIVLVLVGSAVLGGSALAGPPNTSTDSARYAWDGIVQNAGVSPYAYVPADDALAPFRTDWLFLSPVDDADGRPQCAETSRIERTITLPSFQVICTTINRPQVPTIYPPAAELYFAGVRFALPPTAEYWPFQLGGYLISLGVTVTLLLALRHRALNPGWAALWAFSPFVMTEAITNSHVDSLAALLAVIASLLVSRGVRGSPRSFLGGLVLGTSIATKLVPVIAAPALLRRQPWKVISGAVLAFALLYVPYIVSTGFGVVGYLPGYLSEEGYDDGSRFALLSFFAPGPASLIIAALLLAATAVLVWRFTTPERPWLGQVVMIGTTLLIVTPHYSWYALLLVPFVALSGRWEWMSVPLALTVQLLVPTVAVARLSFAVAVVVVLAGFALRRRARHPGSDAAPLAPSTART